MRWTDGTWSHIWLSDAASALTIRESRVVIDLLTYEPMTVHADDQLKGLNRWQFIAPFVFVTRSPALPPGSADPLQCMGHTSERTDLLTLQLIYRSINQYIFISPRDRLRQHEIQDRNEVKKIERIKLWIAPNPFTRDQLLDPAWALGAQFPNPRWRAQ